MKKNSLTREEAEQIYNTLKKRVESFVLNADPQQNQTVKPQSAQYAKQPKRGYPSWNSIIFLAGFMIAAGSVAMYYYNNGGFKFDQSSSETKRASVNPSLSTNSSSLEELALQLEAKRVNLEQKENELQAKEGELRFIESVLNEKLEDIKSAISRLKALKDENYQKNKTKIDLLVNLVLAMPAKEAAGVLQGLDNDVVVEILSKMPERRSGTILNFFNRERAVRIARLMSQPEATSNPNP